MIKTMVVSIIAFLVCLMTINTVFARTFVSIGTGAVTGVYYPTGGAIAKMLNKKYKKYNIKATVESTGGSVYNINAVLTGDLDFGIAQADRQYQAYKGLSEWKNKGPQPNLRAVFSIHDEAVTLIASGNSNINTPADLKDKRINLGNPGSGQLQNAKDVLNIFGLNENNIKAEYIKAVEAPHLLQDERIDAFFFTVGHPNGNIQEAASGRIKIKIVPIVGKQISKLIKDAPYYSKTTIPLEYYDNILNKEDIDTIGIKATLVTASNINEDVVYALTKEVFDNFESFKKLHPAYKTLTKGNMLKGLTAPLHKGAIKYYKESGLMKFVPENSIK